MKYFVKSKFSDPHNVDQHTNELISTTHGDPVSISTIHVGHNSVLTTILFEQHEPPDKEKTSALDSFEHTSKLLTEASELNND